MLILKLHKEINLPLHRQVYIELKALIDKGILPPGTKLPATRVLAEKHGLSRSTVLKAYEELWALGYVESRPGSYSFVRNKTPNIATNQRAEKRRINWQKIASPSSEKVRDHFLRLNQYSVPTNDNTIIDMASFELDDQLFPSDDFRKCLNKVLIESGGALLNYGDVEGYFPLRNYIAQRLQAHGTFVTPDEILITNGIQQSLDLIFRLLTQPGSKIVLESPTYLNILPLLKFYQCEMLGVEMEPDGINLPELERKIQQDRPAFIYTMPNFQNPTGISMSQEKREKLLALGEKHRIPLVEDAFEEEMKYYGKVSLPIKSMDKHQVVIYLGSFSKVLFPGIRLGWLAADREFIRRIVPLKKYSDLASNFLIQAACYEFCRQGFYEMHIKRMHRIYRKRMQVALKALTECLPFKYVSWNEPLGGYLIWLKLEKLKISEPELHAIFQQHGVAVAPGSAFFDKQNDHLNIRICISELAENEISEGIRRLGIASGKLYSSAIK